MNLAPSALLLFAVAAGGLRSWEALGLFAAVFAVVLVLDRDFSFSGLGIWGALAFWLAAGLAFSPEPLNSFRTFSAYALFFAFFMFCGRRGPSAGRSWTITVMALGAAAAGLSVAEASAGISPGRILGVNPGYGAAFTAASAAGAAAVFAGARGRARALSALLLVFLSAGLVASHSRSGMLGALAAVIYLSWRGAGLRRPLLAAAVLLLVIALLPGRSLDWMMKLDAPLSLERLKIWRTALQAAAAFPAFGAGAGLFERAFEMFKFPFYNGISFYGHSTPHAHSSLLNMAAEAGLPAAALLALGWGRSVFSADDGRTDTAVLKAFSVSLFVQASVDVVLYAGVMQLFFFGTLGLLAATGKREELSQRSRAAALAALFACWSAAALLHVRFERARTCALDPGTAPAVREACLKRASKFAPGDRALLMAAAPVSAALYGNYALTAAAAETAALARPKDPFPLFDRAEALYRAGAAGPAKQGFLRALAVEPAFRMARLRLAGILAEEKDYRAARAELARLEAARSGIRPSAQGAYDRRLLEVLEDEFLEVREKIWRRR